MESFYGKNYSVKVTQNGRTNKFTCNDYYAKLDSIEFIECLEMDCEVEATEVFTQEGIEIHIKPFAIYSVR